MPFLFLTGDDPPSVRSVLAEAFRIASAEPSGPVYRAVPREFLTGSQGRATVPGGPTPRALPGIDRSAVERATKMLLEAENPFILTPPIGMNVFFIAGANKDVPMSTIFLGSAFFLPAFLVCLLILIFFPQLTLFLPNLIIGRG